MCFLCEQQGFIQTETSQNEGHVWHFLSPGRSGNWYSFLEDWTYPNLLCLDFQLTVRSLEAMLLLNLLSAVCKNLTKDESVQSEMQQKANKLFRHKPNLTTQQVCLGEAALVYLMMLDASSASGSAQYLLAKIKQASADSIWKPNPTQ